jgi:long-chain-fatty-acid--[acyl-carrier-protein] ligase
MTGAPTKLAVLNTDGAWTHHPWPEVHARAENVAERIANDRAKAVGLVGDPTVEFLAAIPGTFFAGAAVSILPGPIRRADPQQWAQATLDRFRSIGVTTVFSHGTQLELLRGRDDAITVHDLVEVAQSRRSTTFRGPERADVAILQGTAGSTGTPRTAQISPAASLANLRGLVTRVNVDHRSRFHSWLPIYHDMGLAMVLVPILGQADLWQAPTSAFAGNPVRLAQVAHRKPGDDDGGAEHGLQSHRQVCEQPVRIRSEQPRLHAQRWRTRRLRGLSALFR